MRVEDTDRERFVEGATERIIENLKWLGIVPENLDSLVIQSERREIYKKHALELVEKGHAYICTCSKEKLDEDRHKQEAEKRPTGYEGHCRELNLRLEDLEDKKFVIRMKMPKTGKSVVQDLIRGNVEFELSLSDDQVILKSDGYPTYHLAAVVDDHEMGITHVVRGEEWLSSTPKHLELYKMFGWDAPKFAHLPIILARDKTKLSKRHGAVSVTDYRNLGYLPESLINFMALLGWNPGDEREIFSLEDLEREFDLENVNKAPAVFDIVKLNSINSQYLVRLPADRIKKELERFDLENSTPEMIEIAQRGGFATTKSAAEYIHSLFEEKKFPDEMLIFKRSDKKSTLLALKKVLDKIEILDEWSADKFQQALEYTVIENGLGNGDVFWPVRVALSGEEKSPSPVELALALGKEESIKRIASAVRKLN